MVDAVEITDNGLFVKRAVSNCTSEYSAKVIHKKLIKMKAKDDYKINSTPPAIKNEFSITDTTANTNPLGYIAFGTVGFLLNLGGAGAFEVDAFLTTLGLFYGGVTLIIVGIMEWKKNHGVNAITYLAFGIFYISDITSGIFIKLGWAPPIDPIALGFVFLIFGFHLFVMLLITLRFSPLVYKLVYINAVLSFWIQAICLWHGITQKVSSYFGVICCFCAMWAGYGEMLNDAFGTTLIPLGPIIPLKFLGNTKRKK